MTTKHYNISTVAAALTLGKTGPNNTITNNAGALQINGSTIITAANGVTTLLATSIVNGDTTHAPDGNSVFDALALKLDANTAITAGTFTKVTVDVDGLVTLGASATTADIADSTNKRYVTDADLTDIGNLSGTNTGDQTATTVSNTPAGNIAATTVQAAINELDSEKVAGNAAITGATNTKITYDAKGLVTAGVAATTADINDSTNRRYVTDADLTDIGNLSGTNTGDQTATTVTNTPAGNIAATTVQAAINELDSEKLALSGGTLSGAINMGTFKITNLGNGSNPQDAVTKSQLDGVAAGALWLNPINDPNLIDDSLSTPPGSPATGDSYIASATATGAWATLRGRAVMWDGSVWVDLLSRVVAVADRFGVSMESATAGAGGLAAKDDQLAQIATAVKALVAIQDLTYTADAPGSAGNNITVAYTTGGTAGSEVVSVVGNAISVQIQTAVSTATQVKAAVDGFSAAAALVDVSITGTGSNAQTAPVSATNLATGTLTYTFTVPLVSNAVYISNANSYHTGHQYDYSNTGWVEFGGLNAVSAGNGLAYAGNVLSVNMGAGIATMPSDEVGIDVHSSGGLMTTVNNSASSTLTGAQLAVKLDGTTLSKSASGLKVAALGITNAEVSASAAIVESKLTLDYSTSSLNTNKANLASPTFTGTVVLPSTTSIGTVTDVEIGYLDGVTSSIQTQLGAKLTSANIVATITNGVTTNAPSEDAVFDALALKANLAGGTFTGTIVLPSTTSIGTVSDVEIGYLDGVTSGVQTQIDAKGALVGSLRAVRATISNANGATNIGAVLPDNAVVVSCSINVVDAYNGTTPTITVGVTGSLSSISDATDSDIASTGLNFNRAYKDVGVTNKQVIATIAGTSSAGSANVLVEYYVA